MMKQIKSNNWLDLLVRFFCWPRTGSESVCSRNKRYGPESSTLGQPQNQSRRGREEPSPEDDGSIACLGFFLYTITCYH